MANEGRAIEVGDHAPPLFGGAWDDGPLPFAELRREPLVLAFLSNWDDRLCGHEQLEQVRAELRGLGATLVAVSPTCFWFFRADDEMQSGARAADLDDGALLDAFAGYGVLPGRADAPEDLRGLFVVDGERRVRFRYVADDHADADAGTLSQPADGTSALSRALRAAGHALLSVRLPARDGLSRRELIASSLVVGFGLAFSSSCAVPLNAAAPGAPAAVATEELDVTLDINGRARALRVEPRVSLLDALREQLGLTGTKKGCDHGQCGACTVLVDGRRINSCLTLAVMVEGKAVTTIEGLADGDTLHPVQAAFVTEDALQCGYCTPGQIMSAVALLKEGHAHSDDEVREHMSGNICRCGAYPNIVVAIQRARQQMGKG